MIVTVETGGLHPSTTACLEALHRLQERADCRNILDLGCGGGILGLTAAHIWEANVLAADISSNAVADTERAIAEHGLQSRVSVVRSDGFSHPAIAEKGPYDLIMANLLAETHMRLATDLKKYSKTGGYCIISGILGWLAETPEMTFRNLGFEIIEEIEVSPWKTYILRHGPET